MEVAPFNAHEESMHAPSASNIEMQANLDVVLRDNNQHDLASIDFEKHVCGPECVIHSRQEAIDEANAALDAILFGNSDARVEPVVVNDQEAVTGQIGDSNLMRNTILDYDQTALQQYIQRRVQGENTQHFDLEPPKVTSDTLEKTEEPETIDEKLQEVIFSTKQQNSSVVHESEADAIYETGKAVIPEEKELAIDAPPLSQLNPDSQIFLDITDDYTKSLPDKDLSNVNLEDETGTQSANEQNNNSHVYETNEGDEPILDNEESVGFIVEALPYEHLDGEKNTVSNLELHNEIMAYIDASFVIENDNGILENKDDTVVISKDGALKKRNYLLEIKEALISADDEVSFDLADLDDEWIKECKELLGSYDELTDIELQDFVLSSLQTLGYEPKLLTNLKNEIAKLPSANQELVLLQILLKSLKIKQDAGDRKITSNVIGAFQDDGSTNIENLAIAISRLLFFGFSNKAIVKLS